jgi:hypothetical protein
MKKSIVIYPDVLSDAAGRVLARKGAAIVLSFKNLAFKAGF